MKGQDPGVEPGGGRARIYKQLAGGMTPSTWSTSTPRPSGTGRPDRDGETLGEGREAGGDHDGRWVRALSALQHAERSRTIKVNGASGALELGLRDGDRRPGGSLAAGASGTPSTRSPHPSWHCTGRAGLRAVPGERRDRGAGGPGDLPGRCPRGRRTSSTRHRSPCRRSPTGSTPRLTSSGGPRATRSGRPPRRCAWQVGDGLHRGQKGAGVRSGRRGRSPATSGHKRVAEILADPDSVPGFADRVKAFSDRLTFQGDMGATGRALRHVQQVPFIGNVVMPFLTTTYHIGVRQIDRSALGLATTDQELFRRAGHQQGRQGGVCRGAGSPARRPAARQAGPGQPGRGTAPPGGPTTRPSSATRTDSATSPAGHGRCRETRRDAGAGVADLFGQDRRRVLELREPRAVGAAVDAGRRRGRVAAVREGPECDRSHLSGRG